MDNITHSLMGATLGCLVKEKAQVSVKRAVLVAVIASNLPDFDFVAKFIYGGDNLAYLMQHRGWSHTLLLSPVLAAVSVLILRWILMKNKPRAPDTLKRLFGIAWLAVLFHLFADFWNDYGVHPFSPFSNKWFYGDFMFIVEPTLWLAMIPLVYYTFTHRWVRMGAIALAALGGGIALLGPQGGVGAFLILVIWGGLVFFAEERFGHKLPPGSVAAAAVLVVLLVFRAGEGAARAEVEGNVERQLKNENVIQLVLSPFPGNPFLWRTIVASTAPNYGYIVRLGTVSVMPGIKGPLAEYYGIRTERLAPMVEPSLESQSTVHWIGEFRGSVLDLTRLAFQNCQFESFLKFARVPFWVEQPGRTVAGDLRYDHEKGMGFAKVELKGGDGSGCRTYNAPWMPPIRFSKVE